MSNNASNRHRHLEWFEIWLASHPWHPRIVPFILYGLFLLLISLLRPLWPASYPLLYILQCSVVLAFLWRYRKLLPELTLRFHWLSIPVGVGVLIAWIGLGWLMAGEFSLRWNALLEGQSLGTLDYRQLAHAPASFATDLQDGPYDFRDPAVLGPGLGWFTLIIRLLGMTIVVPLFEELFIRSLILRSFHSPRQTAIGFVQMIQDLPLIGDWLIHTDLGIRAHRHPAVFGPQFLQTPVGKLSLFGVAASTGVFMISHLPRDWPGCIACGLGYCLLLCIVTRNGQRGQLGIGSIVWAHGITNALLWAYTLYTNDWQFL